MLFEEALLDIVYFHFQAIFKQCLTCIVAKKHKLLRNI